MLGRLRVNRGEWEVIRWLIWRGKMSRPYELKRFLRMTPEPLLDQYAASNNLSLGLKFAELKKQDFDDAAAALADLADAQRQKLDADFRDIDALASERGIRAIEGEADWHVLNNPGEFGGDYNLRERLADKVNDHERAMWIFLNRSRYWLGALRFFQADSLPLSRWWERKNLPRKNARVDERTKAKLEQAIGNYSRVMHGRGKRCKVEMWRRENLKLDYFHCFTEGFSEAPHSWVDGHLGRHPRNPAHEIIFAYSKKEGRLSTYAQGGKSEVFDLEAIFADFVLGIPELEPSEADTRIYDLDVLKRRDFVFRYPANSEIEDVVVRSLRFRYSYGEKAEFTIKGDYKANRLSVYDELEKHARAIDLDELEITRAELGIHFFPTEKRRARVIRAALTAPNRCTLRYDPLDLAGRAMLAASGLELREPSE